MKLKIALATVVATGLLGLGMALNPSWAGPEEKGAPKADPTTGPRTQRAKTEPAEEKDAQIEFSGVVLDGSGKSVEGASVLALVPTGVLGKPLTVSATTGPDGKFTAPVPKRAFNPIFLDNPGSVTTIIVRAKGHDLGLSRGAHNAEIRLNKESTALTGRLINLEGKPLSGASVQIVGLHQPTDKNLDPFIKGLDLLKSSALAETQHLLGFSAAPDVGPLLPQATTGADGRFTVPGIGAERVVDLLIRGDGLETRTVRVLMRDFKLRVVDELPNKRIVMDGPKLTYLGNGFDLAVNRGRTVTGVVRDRATGKPVPGVSVYEYRLSTDPKDHAGEPRRPVVTDAEGKYTMRGLPVGGQNTVLAAPSRSAPYLLQSQSFGPPEGFGSVAVDFSLVKGVPIKVRGIDKVTREPVRGTVDYFAFNGADTRAALKNFAFPNVTTMDHVSDGKEVHFVVPPVDGAIGFRVLGPSDPYVRGVGTDRLADKKNGDFIDTLPYILFPQNYHAVVRIHPKATDGPTEIVVELERGVSVKGRITGPDGKPFKGTFDTVGLKRPREYGAVSDTDEFTVEGLAADVRRTVILLHREKKLAGAVVVDAASKEPTVKLGPWASVRGQIVDEDGKPVANALVQFFRVGPGGNDNHGSVPGGHRTDGDGSFHIEGFCTGVEYDFGIMSNFTLRVLIGNKMTFRSGEIKDVGTLTAK
jgi:protocatechuate 3,4-dioxygenase beta subunit